MIEAQNKSLTWGKQLCPHPSPELPTPKQCISERIESAPIKPWTCTQLSVFRDESFKIFFDLKRKECPLLFLWIKISWLELIDYFLDPMHWRGLYNNSLFALSQSLTRLRLCHHYTVRPSVFGQRSPLGNTFSLPGLIFCLQSEKGGRWATHHFYLVPKHCFFWRVLRFDWTNVIFAASVSFWANKLPNACIRRLVPSRSLAEFQKGSSPHLIKRKI